jgi:hypothetical protein
MRCFNSARGPLYFHRECAGVDGRMAEVVEVVFDVQDSFLLQLLSSMKLD